MNRDNHDRAHRAAVTIVRVLQEAGHTAYLAGGCVRDTLRGVQPKDYDVATDAQPHRVRGLFRNSRRVGESFGVVLVRIMGCSIDVATFRSETGYADGRHPSQVRFSDAQHDALRRDFTINGLFEDPLAQDPDQRVIDHVGGVGDLRAGVLRAIGDPEQRFGEDYLRMLRAVRFAAGLGMKIEPRTAVAIRHRAGLLTRISRERIGQELSWMLSPTTGPDPAKAARLLQDLRLDGPTLMEEHTPVGLATVHALTTDPLPLRHGSSPPTFPAVLAAWMLDRHFFTGQPMDTRPGPSPNTYSGGSLGGDDPVGLVGWMETVLATWVCVTMPALTQRWRKALCLNNRGRDRLVHLLTLLPRVLRWPRLGVAERKRLLADPDWPQALSLVAAVRHAPGGGEMGIGCLVRTIDTESGILLAQGVAPRPWVSGDDLIRMGCKPGPHFGRLLQRVYDAQLEGSVADREDALHWLRRLGVTPVNNT